MSDGDASDRVEIEAELARILATPEFQKNQGAANFLKFVVEETLEGRGDRLKAFTIATMVFARDESFDAQSNSAVRVQALRLRNLLQAYYADAGRDDPLRIVLRAGSYKPAFARIGAPLAGEDATVAQPAPAPPAPPNRGRRPVAALIALGVVAFAALWLATRPASPPASLAANAPPTPVLVVERAPMSDNPAGKLAAQILDRVEVEISAYDNVVVRKPDGAATQAWYALSLKPVTPDGKAADLAFELLRQPDGVIVWSKIFPHVAIDDSRQAAQIADRLAQSVGDAYGAIDLDVIRHLADFDGKPRGFNCTLCAFAFLKNQSMDRLRVARDCLELAVSSNAHDDGAKALLAVLLVHYYVYGLPESRGEDDLARAAELAQSAYQLAPERARSHFALFVTRFYARHYAEGFASAQKTLEINPLSQLFNRAIGSARIARADYASGETLLGPVRDDVNDTSSAVGALALSAFMRGDFPAAGALLARPLASERALGLSVQVALCGQTRDIACARQASDRLRNNFPGLAEDIGAGLDRAGMADPIRKSLLDAMRAGGFFAGGGE